MESETLELKKSLGELKEGIISLVAMLNKQGEATVLFGISPKGKVLGFDITEKTLRDVSQAIAAHIEPNVYPKVEQRLIDGKTCLQITAEGWQQPYFAYGRAYIRVADEDKKLSASELKNLILQNSRDALRWEDEPCGLTIEQLSAEKINAFLERAGLPEDTAANALEKLDLLVQNKPSNAAKLFFAEQPIQLRCAVFATTSSSTILDRHDFDGDVLQLIDAAEKYVLQNIHIGMRLEGLYRVDVPEIATKAIREALVNAFCHRDWRDPDYVQVAIFKDRVEIRSPGTLYGSLTLEEIIKGNVSRRRNPKIAEMLRRIHLVEAWGRGVPLILENAPETTFFEIGGLFVTRFERPSSKGLFADETVVGAPITPKKHQENTKETPKKHQEDIKNTLLQLLQQQPEISVRALAEQMGVSQNSARHHLRVLQQLGKVRRHGPTKGGYWEVVNGK